MNKRLPRIIAILIIIAIIVVATAFKFNFGFAKNQSKDSTSDKYITKNTKHFLIQYNKEDSAAAEIIKKLEEDYDQINADLKSPKFDKIIVKIYNDREEYSKDVESVAPKYDLVSNVVPVAEDKIYIKDSIDNDPKEEKITENQLIMSLTRYAMNLINPYPGYKSNWLTQGLTTFELQKQTGIRYYPKYKDNKFPGISDLNLNPKISVQVSYTLIQYISEKWGMPAVVELLKNNCDTDKTLNVSADKLEKEWHQYLANIN